MSDVMSQIGDFLSSNAGKTTLGAGVGGVGLLQQFMADREASKKQKFVEDLITNPAKFSAFVSGFNQPLQAGLTNNVARSADAYGAERGLGSSPAVMKDVYAQALAPYLLQQQGQAENAALQSLGIYENSPTTKPIDISSILKALMMPNQPTPTPGGSNPISIDVTGPSTQLPSSLVGGGGGFDPVTMENN